MRRSAWSPYVQCRYGRDPNREAHLRPAGQVHLRVRGTAVPDADPLTTGQLAGLVAAVQDALER